MRTSRFTLLLTVHERRLLSAQARRSRLSLSHWIRYRLFPSGAPPDGHIIRGESVTRITIVMTRAQKRSLASDALRARVPVGSLIRTRLRVLPRDCRRRADVAKKTVRVVVNLPLKDLHLLDKRARQEGVPRGVLARHLALLERLPPCSARRRRKVSHSRWLGSTPRTYRVLGQMMTRRQIYEAFGVHGRTFLNRLKLGWTIERAAITPPQMRELTTTVKAQIHRIAMSGATVRDIASVVRVHPDTVRRCLRDRPVTNDA